MPPRNATPSPTMLKALRMALAAGLERRKGGYWTYPGCPAHRVGMIMAPDTYVEIRTIDACVLRGWMTRDGENYDSPAHLTEKGKLILKNIAEG